MLRGVTSRDWDPNEWQAHCLELLTVHYGVRVQVFPDRMQGDGGLEAFVSDESTAFQCYAPESPFGVAQQTEAQKNKIRADTKKLIDKPERTQKLIGEDCRIRQWVLLTPAFEDKDLVAYANSRSMTVRDLAAAHSWCAQDFRISIHDETLFAVARAKLMGAPSNRILPASNPVSVGALRASGVLTKTLDDTLNTKLLADPKIALSPQLGARYREETLADYFRGKIELNRLLREAASVHRSVTDCAEIVFTRIARSIAESDNRPLIVVKAIGDELASLIEARIPGLGRDLCMLLARFYIASWWIECPLQFEVANA